MIRWGALWAMARKNLRKAWLRHTVLALVLTLAIAGDVLLGMFFAGLEARAGALAPDVAQNLSLLVLAPDEVNMEVWVTWAAHSGTFYGARNYEDAHFLAWRDVATAAGRTRALALEFDIPEISRVPLEGRWPHERDEVALPRGLARLLATRVGGRVTLVDVQTGQQEEFRVTGVFDAEATMPARPRTPQEIVRDPALDFPLLALHPGNSPSPRWQINGSYITLRHASAASMERRMRSYFEREYPAQPAMARLSVAEPIFIRPDLGPEHGGRLGTLIFAPGRRALAASFVFIGTGIFVILLIAFIERKRELAVLKTVGMNNRMVLAMVLLELGAVALVALVLGSVLAVVLGGAIAQGVEYMPPPTVGAWAWAVLHTALVLFLATGLPLSMMRLATVQQLLQNERLYIFRKRVTLS